LLFLYLETGIPNGDGRAWVCSESISQVGSSSSSSSISSKHDVLTTTKGLVLAFFVDKGGLLASVLLRVPKVKADALS